MNTHNIELPPLPLTSFIARRPYETEFTPNYSVGHMRQYARAAIEPYKQRIAELEAQLEAIGAGGVTQGQRLIEADRQRTSKQRYDDAMSGYEEPDPIERLRFFCSIAMTGQDWLDVEPFFDDIIADRQRRGEPVAWQWLDTAHFRKKIPSHSNAEEWRPLFTAPQPAEPEKEPPCET